MLKGSAAERKAKKNTRWNCQFWVQLGWDVYIHRFKAREIQKLPVHVGFNTPSKDKTGTEESEQQAIAAAPAFQVIYHLILYSPAFKGIGG